MFPPRVPHPRHDNTEPIPADDDGLPVYTEPPPRGSSGLGASATRARLRGFPNDKGLNT